MSQREVNPKLKAMFERMTAGVHGQETKAVIFFEAVEVEIDEGRKENAIRLVFSDRSELTLSEDGMAHHLAPLSEFVQQSWRGNTQITARIYKKDGKVERVVLYGSPEQYREFYNIVYQ